MEIKDYILKKVKEPHTGWDGNTYILIPEEDKGDNNV